jgi:hypothetical protein
LPFLQVTFKDLVEGLTASSAGEKATVASLRNKFGRYNPKGCLPISLRVLGATVGTDSDLSGHYTFKITDAKGKPIQSANAYKHGKEELMELGFPLHLLRQDTSCSALEEPPNLLDDHKQYWHIELKDLTHRVTTATDPVRAGPRGQSAQQDAALEPSP